MIASRTWTLTDHHRRLVGLLRYAYGVLAPYFAISAHDSSVGNGRADLRGKVFERGMKHNGRLSMYFEICIANGVIGTKRQGRRSQKGPAR